MLATPMDFIMSFDKNYFYQPGAPIYTATAKEAIANDSSRYLQEAADPTGARSKSLFTNPTLYGSSFSDQDPHVRAFNIRPKNLMDPILDRELNLKAQYYNQSVVGQTMWSKMIQSAENYKQLKEFTTRYAQANPQAALEQRRVEGRQKAELERLRREIGEKRRGNISVSHDINIAKKIFEITSSTFFNPYEVLRTSVYVTKNQIQNPSLKNLVESTLQALGVMPVLSTKVHLEKSENGASITQDVGDSNGLLQTVTRGTVNPMVYMQPGLSV